MTKFARIKDHNGLVRDMYSKAILATDASLVKKHEQRMISLQKEEARDAEINSLKQDIAEIKNLLKSLISSK